MPEMITEVPKDIMRPNPESQETEDQPLSIGGVVTGVKRNIYELNEDGSKALDENGKKIVIGREIDPDPWELVGTEDDKLVVQKETDDEILTKTVSPVGLTCIRRANPEADASRRVVEQESTVDRAEVKEELGEKAVEQAVKGVEGQVANEPMTPGEYQTKLLEGLSDDDALELRSYADSHISYKRAQDDGRGDDSRYFQQMKGQSLRAMSPAAKSIASRYLNNYLRG
ncbi:hypothetical protein GW746_02230 [Candidatus Saccharibacteria bacterium]|nr:hypothetical protein [Candidatus Saccharibacteria bacterium]NCS83213.1 hypothetical protein [Candidatus Saccharibacteria bacterium]